MENIKLKNPYDFVPGEIAFSFGPIKDNALAEEDHMFLGVALLNTEQCKALIELCTEHIKNPMNDSLCEIHCFKLRKKGKHKMNINRLRPKPGEDLELFLSNVVNDALRDVVEAGLSHQEAVNIVLSLAQNWQKLGSSVPKRPL